MPPVNNAHPATQALHADNRLNLVTDVAPPIHLSTTFRHPGNPNDLVPPEDPIVRAEFVSTPSSLACKDLRAL